MGDTGKGIEYWTRRNEIRGENKETEQKHKK